ncbi:hypothetical protein ACRS6B_02405 [Nocardia asteroides]
MSESTARGAGQAPTQWSCETEQSYEHMPADLRAGSTATAT